MDARGVPVVDPTANVTALVEAGMRRQDDLRRADARRQDDLATVRAYYEEKLRDKETQRIDAIRAVDVGAVSIAAERAGTQAATLAQQVTTSAEAMRVQVAAAAQAAATALGSALEPIQKDVADLRRIQYEQQGQRVAVSESKGDQQFTYASIISSVVAFMSIATLVVYVLLRH